VLNVPNGSGISQPEAAAPAAKSSPSSTGDSTSASLPSQVDILLVACLSAFGDPGSVPAVAQPDAVLSPALCSALLSNIVERSLSPAQTKAPARKPRLALAHAPASTPSPAMSQVMAMHHPRRRPMLRFARRHQALRRRSPPARSSTALAGDSR
jgi:hypothetical protein